MIRSFATKIFFLSFWLLIGLDPSLSAQQSFITDFSYGLQTPLGRLQDRFGYGYRAGMSFKYHTGLSGLMVSLDGTLLFGDRVKEDVLQNLRTSEGLIYGNDKTAANIQLRMRGRMLGLSIGKQWTLSEVSGIRFSAGAGYLNHHIRIQDDPLTTVPQLSKAYKKGYDRLEGGILLYNTLDWIYSSRDKKVNLSLGLESMLGSGTGLRSYQFDLLQPYTDRQSSAWIGLRAAWILPLYNADNRETWY